ncbi:hypothetical protein E2C01_057426 [Portunus trituberculatus]|uniref:Uncharacterized protein n=1 Tax=Portunus trituberculatus TaxID=210409 RepID=A0A5B7H2D3_PORTR|nr:hypothetical protein [Portunus trituberculatus]
MAFLPRCAEHRQRRLHVISAAGARRGVAASGKCSLAQILQQAEARLTSRLSRPVCWGTAARPSLPWVGVSNVPNACNALSTCSVLDSLK